MLPRINTYGLEITCAPLYEVVLNIFNDIENNSFGYVCAANVHMLMEARDSKEFQKIVNNSKYICPDGMPLVWIMKKNGCNLQRRVTGYDICLAVCERAAKEGISVGILGSKKEKLDSAARELKGYYKDLNIAYLSSPDVNDNGCLDDDNIVKDIKSSGVEILFVALGCPKQEIWMNKYANDVNAMMVGVGAVVDFLAGSKKRAPIWMQDIGLEWFYRLILEPKRLFRRYVVLNSRFVVLLVRQKIIGNV